MKYIRTKDEIYELEHDGWLTKRAKPKHIEMLVAIDDEHYEMRKIIHTREIGKSHWKTEIIKQADTIEELCDEFVVIGIFENQIGCCCDTFKEAKELKDYVELPQEQIIYGAIWTDKGLIYVAKMNNKGELELI